MFRTLFVVLLLLGLASCAGTPGTGRGGSTVGEYKVGKPYQVGGEWYSPNENFQYDETGLASWYGPGFHGNRTANGETFDSNELTAAHRTLPMPSLVRVTNLENGKSVVVRVNDRGPFAKGRIIDVSSRAADLLGFKSNGVAKVRVQILEAESRAIAEGAKKRMGQRETMVASNSQPIIRPVDDNSDQVDSGSNQADNVNPNDVPSVQVSDADNALAQDNAPQTASLDKVDSVPLDAPEPGTVLKKGSASSTLQVRQTSEKPLAAVEPKLVPPKFKSRLPEPQLTTVEGKTKNGRFYPAPVVEQGQAKPDSQIYVQAGAFASKDNASKLLAKLTKFGKAGISEAMVNGTNFYRVRLGPISSPDEADRILQKVMGQSSKAKITVE